MTDLPNPHDRFFKELFSQLETVTDFVRYYLPGLFVALLDLRQLEIVKESFIDEELRQYFSDLLLRVRLKNGAEAFIYLSKIEVNKGEARLRAGLTTLNYIFSDDLLARLAEIFSLIKQLPEARAMGNIRTVLKYLSGGPRRLSLDDVRTGLKTAFPEKEGGLMQTFAEAWIQEGEQRGGQKEAAKLTLRQLHRRFGIFEADLDEMNPDFNQIHSLLSTH